LAAGTLPRREPTYTLVIKDHRISADRNPGPAGWRSCCARQEEDPTPEECESVELRREKVIPGGEQIIVYIGPLKPGRYEFFGDFNPATARGHIVVK
jgi:hypothetical protein